MSHEALSPDQFDSRATDWQQFDNNPHYRRGRQDGFRGDYQDHEHLSAKAEMGMPLHSQEIDYMAGHAAGLTDARSHATSQERVKELWEKHGVDKDTHDWDIRFRES